MSETLPLTDEQIDAIAEKAAQRALDKVYADVGRGVLKKLAWLVGIAVVGLLIWLAKDGHLPTLGGE